MAIRICEVSEKMLEKKKKKKQKKKLIKNEGTAAFP